MRDRVVSLLSALRQRLRGSVVSQPGATGAAPPGEAVKISMALSETLPGGIAHLPQRYADRGIELFLLDRTMVKRQDFAIARAVHSFFQTTATYRDVDVATIARHVAEFRDVYLDSPITKNVYGLNFPSGAMLFLMARCLDPKLIVESGVYKGLSSYVLAAACPRASIHAFDPNLREVEHRSRGVTYHECDWMNVELNCAGRAGLCFFDDHQSQAVRVVQAHKRGFRHIVVDDSWPIEVVTGCGWPPLPSIDMIMNGPLALGEVVKWVESGKMWTYVHNEEMQQLSARARNLIQSAYEVPSLYRECGIAPKSALKFVELA